MTTDSGRHNAAFDPESATNDECRAYAHGYWDGLDAGTSLPGDHPLLATYRQDWEAESDSAKRAASWWEAAKRLARSRNDFMRLAMGQKARADAAEAKIAKLRNHLDFAAEFGDDLDADDIARILDPEAAR